ncbi:MAG: O-antigen ligase family protein [Candidatus Eisenbacteria bacterium]
MRVALVAATLGFVPGLLDPFNGPKAAVLRLIGLPLLLFVAVDAARAPRSRRGVPCALDLAVAFWVVGSLCSAAFGLSPRLSLLGELGQREGVLTVLALAGVYAAARRSHHETGHARATLTTALAAATLAAAYAMLQRAGLDPLSWESGAYYPGDHGAVLRVFASLGNPILLGTVLAAALAAGLARALAPGARNSWLLPALVLTAAATAATLARGAMLAALCGVVAAVLPRWGARQDRARTLGTLAWVALPAAAWTLLALRAPLAARIAESVDPRAESSPARVALAQSALAIWREHPWTGVGPDAFGLAFPAAQTAEFWRNGWLGMPVHAHSAALQMLTTGGLLATAAAALWLMLLVRALRGAPAAPNTPAASVASAAPTSASVPSAPSAATATGERSAWLAGLVALAAAAAFNAIGIAGAVWLVTLSALAVMRPAVVPAAPDAGTSSRHAIAAMLALALAVSMGVFAWREGTALSAAGRAHDALLETTRAPREHLLPLLRIASESSRRAVALGGSEDELWRLHSDVALAHAAADSASAERGVLLADAEHAARRALALEPRRASNVQRLANALAARGALAEADSAFDRAVALAPYDALILVDRVRFEAESGRLDRALVTARQLATMYPDEAVAHSIEAGIWLTLGRAPEARTALDRALGARWEAGSEGQHEAARRARKALGTGDSLR